MENIIRRIAIVNIIAILLSTFIMIIPAYAGVDGKEISNSFNKNGVTSIPPSISGKVSDTQTSEYSRSFNYKDAGGQNRTVWYKPDDAESIKDAVDAYGTSTRNDEEVKEALATYNLKADTAGAHSALSGFMDPLAKFLGVITYGITIGMVVFTALDLAYISFPVFRGKMDDAKANGTAGLTRQGKGGETKLNFITEDAQYAMTTADTATTGASPYIIYGKKRIISFVVLSILIFILVTGRINIFAELGIKLADGVLKMISGVN